jgi:hypothetical protein
MPKAKNNPVFIVILQRGWVIVGRLSQAGSRVKLTGASVIRRWGTTKGLPELANGPLSDTILDSAPLGIEYHELTEIARIPCVEDKWASHCR